MIYRHLGLTRVAFPETYLGRVYRTIVLAALLCFLASGWIATQTERGRETLRTMVGLPSTYDQPPIIFLGGDAQIEATLVHFVRQGDLIWVVLDEPAMVRVPDTHLLADSLGGYKPELPYWGTGWTPRVTYDGGRSYQLKPIDFLHDFSDP